MFKEYCLGQSAYVYSEMKINSFNINHFHDKLNLALVFKGWSWFYIIRLKTKSYHD